ncbi:class I SAM-dependent methyltransferase [Patescibacteria group bacterium]|nr:class I SAM-dependent methyltransferase [Patescibacteria group bacterium]
MPRPAASTSWERVSRWYTTHLKQDDFLQRDVVIPGTLALLADAAPGTHLDVACGEGSFAQAFLQAFPRRAFVGVDAAPSLIRSAQLKQLPRTRFIVGDAQRLPHLPEGTFSSATCLLAIQNIADASAVFHEVATRLSPDASLVIVMNHPYFRQPKQSSWGWDEERKIQYRRVDRYLESYKMEIVAHPGKQPSITTASYHRSLGFYIQELAHQGFMIDALEEWTSPAQSDSGPRANAENIARQEIPLFLAIRARLIRTIF